MSGETTVAGGEPPYVTTISGPAELRAVMRADYEVSAQQWAAISAPLSPGVVVAGAGSGKTTLMAARVVYLVVTGQVRPDQVLGLTFTTKATGELRGKVRAALVTAGVLDADADVEDTIEPTVATYHAYAAQLLDEHGLRIGHEPDTRVVTDASRYQLGARTIDRYRGEVRSLSDHPPTVVQNLLALDAAMTEHLVAPEDVAAFDEGQRGQFVRARQDEADGKARSTYLEKIDKAISAIDRRSDLLGLVRAYRRHKADLGLMEFSDQIALGARLATEQPEVGAAERAKYAVVLLDEYQDTSVAQALMLSRLFSGPTAEAGRGHPVTAVGDPNQAIYGWRGASVSNILGFAATFPAADGGAVPVLPLTVNRRSDRRILEVANALAQPLYDALPQVQPLVAAGEDPGEVATRVFETVDDELAWLAEQVRAVHDPDAGVAWSDVGVLARDNGTAAAVFDALSSADVPVEIVGLSGLLRLPEVAEVVATLTLLHDVTANTALLTVLTGSRWAVGPRDLRLLAARAAELAGRPAGAAGEDADLAAQLGAIADGIDPAETPALSDALADPGDAAYSEPARERFALLTSELRSLRASVGEPLLDLVRRIVDVTGVDVELASAVGPAAATRRDNLDLFLKAVGDFQSIDGDVSVAALLAYLTAEDDQGNGLDVAVPSRADSVKLLTVHRSKGLEWHTVFLVGMCESRFPSGQSRTLWVSSPAVLPAPLRGDAHDLPQLRGHDKAALEAYRADVRAHEATEELRLGYVALTRAAHRLVVTSHQWGRRATAFGPSPYQAVVRDCVRSWGEEPVWLDKPAKGEPNPYDPASLRSPWPLPGLGREATLRLAAAEQVRAAAAAGPEHAVGVDAALDLLETATVAAWDAEIERLIGEARAERADVVEVPLPTTLSATSLARVSDDPDGLARDLARPMPRSPSRAARFGTRFHAWVEARLGQQQLLDPEELPGRGDVDIEDEADLAALQAAFEAGPFAERIPHAVEAGFALVLAGQAVRGRIDAVYAEPDGSWLVVDWKTGRHESADPLQLAVYRTAWAELVGVPLERVRAAFCWVRTGRTHEPDDLPDRAGLEALLGGSPA